MDAGADTAYAKGNQAPFSVRILTLFPEMFPGPLGLSLLGKALADEVWSLETVDIRAFASDKHRSVDDAPFGGGAGMVMKPDVIDAALGAVKPRPGRLLYLSPRGKLLNQALAKELAAEPALTLLCGRYEGVDQRVIDAWDMEEVSLGDFVLTGGEIAAMALVDAVVRLLPGVVGKTESLEEESFERGLLEYPLYTRPADWKGRVVPEVLLSGHHARVAQWRLVQSECITRHRRPDLWERYCAQKQEQEG
ncbi:tRNA (guanosine(37)-N1)-methyltransferase TrmD [Haematospirillum jordaniae]|uniref:tRNA (guanine-N(1)-)-methyltransferase n=1 Tax=Haematospirillum jordaniae TaxID=1549855 RepID=A0A143DD89_9PROT|nr:tRNA (guanosine(37)-N1)-methyltransferase TrmD [Haematospirillum jordaniae]AMW34088.1 tRNA (guanine-N1)-methyltransferase [Haematospirillum jordaniae]NKD45273.1 tRNA (guanosine(37)-N1)-methyltransferase TrmD [Haematospirillum jordaniae]NKD57265.1 tRNA (guanosine(37)-N1)-methyltransferase TrmD [Haematospirillum jordaniae]NKD59619.1 tRNA (guanosine(37)-N1)-methyltransferase TrmD [Haematospirillum jordaniae]NKD67191.1 tRNA (guanosine(37)-N1)-methyltransferase TrmD [Haematospirillum jordaniae]